MFKSLQFSFMRKADPAGVEHGRGGLIPGAVFVIAHQREPSAGELDPDLVTAAGVKPDMNQGSLSFGQTMKFQPGGLNALTHPLDHEHLVFAAVFPQKILPVAGLGWSAMDQTTVFFYHVAVLDGF